MSNIVIIGHAKLYHTPRRSRTYRPRSRPGGGPPVGLGNQGPSVTDRVIRPMSTNTSVDDSDRTGPPAALGGGDQLVATVVTYDDAPDECTLYPLDATEQELLTCWLSAETDSFVALEDAR